MRETDPHWGGFKRRLLAVVATVVILLAAWHLFTPLLLTFAAALFGVFLDGLSRMLRKVIPVPRRVGLAIVCVLLAGAAFLFSWWMGPRMLEQLSDLEEQIPAALDRIREWISTQAGGQTLLDRMPPPTELLTNGGSALSSIRTFFSSLVDLSTAVFFILLAGLYAAISPNLYVGAVRHLVPPARRERADEVTGTLGHVMRRWLVGRFVSMTVVGVLTWLGLMLAGVPLALGLGFIAGALSFVPFIGPLASAVPAILVGLLQSPLTALWVVVVFSGVQLLESNLITPLVQQRAVSLPPALVIGAQLIFGTLAGLLGILLATPLAVMVCVLIQTLYVQDVLDDDVPVLGDS